MKELTKRDEELYWQDWNLFHYVREIVREIVENDPSLADPFVKMAIVSKGDDGVEATIKVTAKRKKT